MKFQIHIVTIDASNRPQGLSLDVDDQAANLAAEVTKGVARVRQRLVDLPALDALDATIKTLSSSYADLAVQLAPLDTREDEEALAKMDRDDEGREALQIAIAERKAQAAPLDARLAAISTEIEDVQAERARVLKRL